MSFFTDNCTIIEIDEQNIFLIRKYLNNLYLDRLVGNSNINSRELITKDILKEYSVDIDNKNNLYIVYQNQKGYLVMDTIKNKTIESKVLTEKGLSEVYNLKMIIKNKIVHIFYMIKLQEKNNRYGIFHMYLREKQWQSNKIIEIEETKIINPFTVLESIDRISILFYRENKIIEIKNLNLETFMWSDEKSLVESKNNKLFIDSLEILDTIHLVYCEFIQEKLVIKHNRINRIDNVLHKEESIISNEGNASYPTILFYDNKIWIVWVELNKIMSRYSNDMGKTWSNVIYTWNNTKNINFVRYKYLSKEVREGILLNYSFGTIYPEINFLGFGEMEDTVEIPLKVNQNLSTSVLIKKGP